MTGQSKGKAPTKRTRQRKPRPKAIDVSALKLPGRVGLAEIHDDFAFRAAEIAALRNLGFDEQAIRGLAAACSMLPSWHKQISQEMPTPAQSRKVLEAVQSLAKDLETILNDASQATINVLDTEAYTRRWPRLDCDGLASALQDLRLLALGATERLPQKEPTRKPVGVFAVYQTACVVESLNERLPTADQIAVKASGAFLKVVDVVRPYIPGAEFKTKGKTASHVHTARPMVAMYLKQRDQLRKEMAGNPDLGDGTQEAAPEPAIGSGDAFTDMVEAIHKAPGKSRKPRARRTP